MIRPAGAPARGDPTGPVPDVGKDEGEEEEEEEEGMQPPLLLAPRNCLPHQGLSILDKLVKTWPVWQQLSLGQAEAARILRQEGPGAFLVRQDSGQKLLCVHFPGLPEDASDVLEYTIKEERSILYLEGSVLVFEDIFRLIAFYCVSRDLLPFPLRLPAAILGASSCAELETICNLGLGFWASSLNLRRGSGKLLEAPRDPAPGAPPDCSLRPAARSSNCACEIELSVGNDRLWFVNPIFLEDCSRALPAGPPVPARCPGRPSPAAPEATSPASKGCCSVHVASSGPSRSCPSSCTPGFGTYRPSKPTTHDDL